MARHKKRKQRANAGAGSGSSSSNNSSVNSGKDTPKKQKTETSTPLSGPVKETLSKFVYHPHENKMADKGNDSLPSQSNESDVVFSPTRDSRRHEELRHCTNADLMAKLCANGAELAKLALTVEELKAALFSVQTENDTLRRELNDARKREQQTATQLAETRHLAELADRHAEEVSAYVRRNNLRIYGVQEGASGAVETGVQCEERVISLFNRKLNIEVKGEDFEAVHRVGSKQGSTASKNSCRGIIVRFVSRRVRDSVLYARKKLKGTGVTIVEDLTPRAYQLLCSVRNERDICQQAWTKNGAVVVKTVTGRISTVKSLAEFRQLR